MDPEETILARFRVWIETWNERGLERVEEVWHEDMVWVEPEGFPDAATHRGRNACVERMRERFDLLGNVKVDLIGGELHGERFLIEATVSGEGTSSGVPAQLPEWWVYEFADDGRIVRWLEFLSRAEAEAALAQG